MGQTEQFVDRFFFFYIINFSRYSTLSQKKKTEWQQQTIWKKSLK